MFLEVSDDGEGIDFEYLEKVFEFFFIIKLEGKGMGLGLLILYGILVDYGGMIEVESEIGVGMIFKIVFFLLFL